MKFAERLIFFLLLITFPIQLGKHFWPNFAFVQGIRVDYLAPTIFVSDIFMLLLFVVSIASLRRRLFIFIKSPPTIFFMAMLLFGMLNAESISEAMYGSLKLFEFTYLALYVASVVERKDYSFILFSLILGSLIQVVILILQFTSQHSLGGMFYFLGERTFDPSTPGIALFRFGQSLILRPYGTFPHPNVLACFLFVSYVFALFSKDFQTPFRSLARKIILACLFIGILLTFSRVILLLLLIGTAIYFGKTKKALVAVVVFGCIVLLLLSQRFENEILRDILFRVDLLRVGWEVFAKSPIVGVGLNNFYYHEVDFQKTITPVLLQPIHNIYLLALCYTGVLGIVPVAFFLRRTFLRLKNGMILLLLVSFLAIGMVDHYLITLQQGQLMFAFIIGLAHSKFSVEG